MMPPLAFFNVGHANATAWSDLQCLVGAMMAPTRQVFDIIVDDLDEYANADQIVAAAEKVCWQIPEFALVAVTCDPALGYSIIRRLRDRGLRVVVPVTDEDGTFRRFREVE